MHEGRWKYRASFGLIAFIAALLVTVFAAIPLLVLVLDTEARAFFFNKPPKDLLISCLAILLYEAFFGLMAYVLYRESIKNWLKSFIRPDCIEINSQGFYQKYQDEEMYVLWSDMLHIQCKPVYINRFDQVNDLIIVLKDGKTLYAPLSELGRPFESISWALLFFVGPFAGAFGIKVLAVSIVLFFIIMQHINNSYNRYISEQIISAAQYHQQHQQD